MQDTSEGLQLIEKKQAVATIKTEIRVEKSLLQFVF